MSAAIYKVLPDRPIARHDVITGAIVTAVLFTIGKSLIGWNLGSSDCVELRRGFGLIIVLLLLLHADLLTPRRPSGQSSPESTLLSGAAKTLLLFSKNLKRLAQAPERK